MFQSFVCRIRHASVSCKEIELILRIVSHIPTSRKRRRSEFIQPPPPSLPSVSSSIIYIPTSARHPMIHPLPDVRSACQARPTSVKKPTAGSSFSAPMDVSPLTLVPQDTVREIPSIVTDAIKTALPKLERHLRRSKANLSSKCVPRDSGVDIISARKP